MSAPPPPQIHSLHLQPIWYDKIASGTKNWEGRLNDSDIDNIKTGDTMEFHSEDRAPLRVEVVQVVKFPTGFEAMLEGGGMERLLPGVEGGVARGLEIYRAFPGYREGERRFGAVGFEIRRL